MAGPTKLELHQNNLKLASDNHFLRARVSELTVLVDALKTQLQGYCPEGAKNFQPRRNHHVG